MPARHLRSLFFPFRGPTARRTAAVRPVGVRSPERLESRTVMAAFTVVAPNAPVSAVRFRSLQDALAAAASTGDTIRIGPNAVVTAFDVSTHLSSNAAVGATTIKTPVAVPFGQVIKLEEGKNSEHFVVIGSQPAAGGLVQLTLDGTVKNAYNSGSTTVSTTGEIAITKSVTLTSLAGLLPGTIDDVDGLQVRADDVLFRNLLVATPVKLMPGADSTTFRNCMLDEVSDTSDGNSGGRTFSDNFFLGDLTLREDGDDATFDRILYNQFQDSSLSLLEGNKSASVRGNEFNMVGEDVAITVEKGTGVVLRQNTITFTSPSGPGDKAVTRGSVGIHAFGGGGASDALELQLINNSIDTGGRGIGILLKNDGLNGTNFFKAKVQGNDFHWNAIGLLIDGSGQAAVDDLGIVDVGGGSLNSLGGNNFRGFTTDAATAGTAFSIYLSNDDVASTQHIPCQNNLWSTTSPNLTVKDSANQSASGGWAWDKGVGSVSVGGSQLTGNQQFVQSLYNEFLGRCGSATEVDSWATKITLGTATRQQAATGIITSDEAYGYYVDGLYRSILQRSADAAGRSSWVAQLRAGGSKESVAANLTASDEYFSRLSLLSLEPVPLPINRTGATGDAAYVTSLYQKYLERLPTNAEVGSWLSAGPMTPARRLSTAQAILTSSEFRTGLIEDDLYYRMLNRLTPPPAADVASWNSSGLLLTQLQIAFASTNEYFLNG